MYGAQTSTKAENAVSLFENDVEMYGAQTSTNAENAVSLFENDVEMYGAQTDTDILVQYFCLRMM